MSSIFSIIKLFQLVFVHRRRSDNDEARVVGLSGRMLNDLLQVLLVNFNGDVLHMTRYTSIIGSEEDSLNWLTGPISFDL